jgi:Developmentally Regulated MAPK Interacting Protein.
MQKQNYIIGCGLILFFSLLSFSFFPAKVLADDAVSSVSITSPAGGENFKGGDTVTITWNQSNVTSVSIGFSDGPNSLNWINPNMAVNLSDTSNSVNWTIPASLAPGSYTIKITAYNNGVSYNAESNPFNIVSTVDTSPKVTFDFKGASLYTGDSLGLQYSITNVVSIDVGVKSCPNCFSLINTIGPDFYLYSNDYYWKIPSDFKPGTYQLEFVAHNSAGQTATFDTASFDVVTRPPHAFAVTNIEPSVKSGSVIVSATNVAKDSIVDYCYIGLTVKADNSSGAILYDHSDMFSFLFINIAISAAPLEPGGIQKSTFDYQFDPGKQYYLQAKAYCENDSTQSTKELTIYPTASAPQLDGVLPDLQILSSSITVDNENVNNPNYLTLNYIYYDVSNLSKKLVTDEWLARTEIFSDSLSGEKIYDKTVKPMSFNTSLHNNAISDPIKDSLVNGKTYVVRITVDSTNVVKESNENNNSAVLSFVFGKKIEANVNNKVAENNTNVVTTKNANAVSNPANVSNNKGVKVDLNLSKKLSGKILLQVQSGGGAYYVDPKTYKKYSLTAVNIKNVIVGRGVGITNADINKIPVALDSLATMNATQDSDKDGYPDKTELQNGYTPNGAGKLKINTAFATKQKGKILIQTQNHGEAWYVNPANGKRYFLGTAANALYVLRNLGLGITDANISKIAAAK